MPQPAGFTMFALSRSQSEEKDNISFLEFLEVFVFVQKSEPNTMYCIILIRVFSSSRFEIASIQQRNWYYLCSGDIRGS